jgi:hypothetical protein
MTSHPTSLPCRTSPRYRRALFELRRHRPSGQPEWIGLWFEEAFREHVPRQISGEGALAYSHSPKAAGRLTARSRHDGFAPAIMRTRSKRHLHLVPVRQRRLKDTLIENEQGLRALSRLVIFEDVQFEPRASRKARPHGLRCSPTLRSVNDLDDLARLGINEGDLLLDNDVFVAL